RFGECEWPTLGIRHFPRKCYKRRQILVSLGLDVIVDRQLVAHGFLAGGRYPHGFGLPVQLPGDISTEMLDDDLNFLGNIVGMEPHPAHQRLHGFALIHRVAIVVLAMVGEPRLSSDAYDERWTSNVTPPSNNVAKVQQYFPGSVL